MEPVTSFRSAVPPRISSLATVAFVKLHDIVPAYGFHIGVDIGGGLGAVIHVIGVFVHVEHEDGTPACQGRRRVAAPLIPHPLAPPQISHHTPPHAPPPPLPHS